MNRFAESISYDSRFANKQHGDIIYVNQIYSYQDKLGKLNCLDKTEGQKKRELLKKIKNTLKNIDSPIRIVVAGGFNAGKSTFLNALLGAEYMPTKAVRSTAIVNCLVAGKRRELIIYHYDGRLEKRGYENAEHLQTQVLECMKHESELIEHIDIVCTEHPFLEKFTLIDTPGTDHSEKDSKISFREIEKADALIWVLHNEGLKKDDDTYITNFRKDNPDKPIIVIINQIDSLDDNELKSVIKTVKTKAAGKVKKIFPLSAKHAFIGHRDNDGLKFKQSRFSEVESYLRSELFGAYGELHKLKLHDFCMPVIQEIDSFLRKREAEQGWVDGTIKSTLLNKKTETLLKKRIDKILGIL